MRGYLRAQFQIEASSLHDCPPEFFGEALDIEARHELFLRLASE